MKIKKFKVYSFSELSDDAKQKALEYLQDINMDNWHEFIIEDAKEIGLKIEDFDIYHFLNARFISSAEECAAAIMKNHGNHCETYKAAENFLNERYQLPDADDETSCEYNSDIHDKIEELESKFLKAISEDYRIILKHEYENLTSEEAIIETIEANEYEFKENGELF
jgi:hypothetical protein